MPHHTENPSMVRDIWRYLASRVTILSVEPPALHDVPLPVGTLSGAVKLWLDADKHRQTFDPPGVGMAVYALATSDLPDQVQRHIDASEEPLAAGAAYPASTLDAFTGNLARPDADGDIPIAMAAVAPARLIAGRAAPVFGEWRDRDTRLLLGVAADTLGNFAAVHGVESDLVFLDRDEVFGHESYEDLRPFLQVALSAHANGALLPPEIDEADQFSYIVDSITSAAEVTCLWDLPTHMYLVARDPTDGAVTVQRELLIGDGTTLEATLATVRRPAGFLGLIYVTEAFQSSRTDIRPSTDPNRTEIRLLTAVDAEGALSHGLWQRNLRTDRPDPWQAPEFAQTTEEGDVDVRTGRVPEALIAFATRPSERLTDIVSLLPSSDDVDTLVTLLGAFITLSLLASLHEADIFSESEPPASALSDWFAEIGWPALIGSEHAEGITNAFAEIARRAATRDDDLYIEPCCDHARLSVAAATQAVSDLYGMPMYDAVRIGLTAADGDMRNTIKYRAVADGGPFAPLSEKDEA